MPLNSPSLLLACLPAGWACTHCLPACLPACLLNRAPPLCHGLQDEDLIQLFTGDEAPPSLRGELEAVRVVRDKATKIGKGFAFVLFRTKVCVHGCGCGCGCRVRIPTERRRPGSPGRHGRSAADLGTLTRPLCLL